MVLHFYQTKIRRQTSLLPSQLCGQLSWWWRDYWCGSQAVWDWGAAWACCRDDESLVEKEANLKMISDYRQRPLAEPSPLPMKGEVHLGWTWGWQWEGTIPWGLRFDRISLSCRAELFSVVLMVSFPPIQTLPNFYIWNVTLSWSSKVLSLHNLIKIYLLQWISLSLRAHWSLPLHPRYLASQLPLTNFKFFLDSVPYHKYHLGNHLTGTFTVS